MLNALFAEVAVGLGGTDDYWKQDVQTQFARTISAQIDVFKVKRPRSLASIYARRLAGTLDQSQDKVETVLYEVLTSTNLRNISDLMTRLEAIDCMPGYADLLYFNPIRFCNFLADSVTRGQAARAQGCPIMPVFAFPKTGSAFVTSVMSDLMDVPAGVASLAHLVGTPAWLAFVGRFPISLHDHMFPTAHNLALLSKSGVSRLVLLIRDPRQVVVSVAHHLLKQAVSKVARARYQQMGLTVLLQHLVATHPRLYQEWLLRWSEDTRSYGIEVFIMKYEDLVADSEHFFHELLDFFQAPPFLHERVGASVKKMNAILRQGGLNFRMGKTDEWRHVLTHSQKQAIEARFGEEFWSAYCFR